MYCYLRDDATSGIFAFILLDGLSHVPGNADYRDPRALYYRRWRPPAGEARIPQSSGGIGKQMVEAEVQSSRRKGQGPESSNIWRRLFESHLCYSCGFANIRP